MPVIIPERSKEETKSILYEVACASRDYRRDNEQEIRDGYIPKMYDTESVEVLEKLLDPSLKISSVAKTRYLSLLERIRLERERPLRHGRINI